VVSRRRRAEVTVVDRQGGPALETSFANGGQISASHAEPWANPRAPLQILKWLGRDDAPLLFRLTGDWRQWRWGLQFLLECLPGRTKRNTLQCLNLALYSRDCLKALRGATGIRYDHLERGILQFYTDAREFADAVRMAELIRRHGCEREVKTTKECVALEPALHPCRERLAGGIYTASDESGDAQRFTQELARIAATRGTVFRWNTTASSLVVEGGAVRGVRCSSTGGERAAEEQTLAADAVVVALGSYSPLLLAPLRVPCPIYPAKGYSATIAINGHRGAPTVSLTDLACKLVFSRLGDRLRVAGTAELSGYGTELNRVRCNALVRRTFDLFPVKPALALSLHSTHADLRTQLLPRAPRIDPAELVALCDGYARATGYPIQYQWTLLEGINDGDDEVDRIATLLAGKYAVMNFIPYNSVDGLDFKRPSWERAAAMARSLHRRGVLTKLRHSAGQDVEGGCGQLRARVSRLGGPDVARRSRLCSS
jgi:D-amino-acid dehydrogenase